MERKEPTISGMESISVEKAGEPAKTQVVPPKQPRAKSTKHSQPQMKVVSKSSPLLPFALVLALTGLGLAGFVYAELLKAQQQSRLAEARIQELEAKLDLSSDESSQSMTAVQAKLKWADSEIRKLWGVSHDRNRKAIAANKKTLDSVSKSAKSAASKVGAAEKQLKAQQAKLDSVTKASNRQGEELQLTSTLVGEQTKQLRELVDEANRAKSQLDKVNRELEALTKRNQEVIDSFDGYRVSTNRQLLELKQQMGNIQPGS